jgi:hypothetical protein
MLCASTLGNAPSCLFLFLFLFLVFFLFLLPFLFPILPFFFLHPPAFSETPMPQHRLCISRVSDALPLPITPSSRLPSSSLVRKGRRDGCTLQKVKRGLQLVIPSLSRKKKTVFVDGVHETSTKQREQSHHAVPGDWVRGAGRDRSRTLVSVRRRGKAEFLDTHVAQWRSGCVGCIGCSALSSPLLGPGGRRPQASPACT